MTFVVTENCIKCKYMDCVEVCPVDCFHEGPNMLVIDPDECIDCAVCIPECPVNAIMPEEDVPGDQQHMIKLNADLSRIGWPSITIRPRRLMSRPTEIMLVARAVSTRCFSLSKLRSSLALVWSCVFFS